MTQEEARQLLEKYLNGRCTVEEKIRLRSWYQQYEQKELPEMSEHESEEQLDRVWQNVLNRTAEPTTVSRTTRLWPRIAAAAAMLAFLSFGLYQYLHKEVTPKSEFANDIAPGTNKPVLTLASGQKIVLSNNQGTIAKQGAVTIKQNAVGQVIYTATNTGPTEASFNTLTNPRASKVVSLILPDGTLAKLDAASSITYPTIFTGKKRNVSTTGRVYFAVNYNKEQPFFSTTKGQTVRDLGTHFIVDAYDDEPSIKTTLIEGSVEVGKDGQKAKLIPGQQSILQSTNNSIVVKQVDLDEETAWVNGDFDFHNQDLRSIMRQLARVYDIDVNYKGNVENMVLNGMISRSHNISAVLEMFEVTNNVHFEIKGRRVMVIAGQR